LTCRRANGLNWYYKNKAAKQEALLVQ
jgi:hypothetical protein